ncbi:MAG: MoaD/ThiS family protein [Anaerolineales bacterium]|jgi:molybdopterin converting factor subunit 1
MNKVQVFFFAGLRDKVGVIKSEMEIPSQSTVADFKDLIVEKFPNIIDSMESTLISVNKEVAFDDEEIPVGAEIALFPPVSGG